MTKKYVLCDGDCGNSYLETELETTTYTKGMCRKCMFTFLADQEYCIESNKGGQDVTR